MNAGLESGRNPHVESFGPDDRVVAGQFAEADAFDIALATQPGGPMHINVPRDLTAQVNERLDATALSIGLIKGHDYQITYRVGGQRADRYARLGYTGTAMNMLVFDGRGGKDDCGDVRLKPEWISEATEVDREVGLRYVASRVRIIIGPAPKLGTKEAAAYMPPSERVIHTDADDELLA